MSGDIQLIALWVTCLGVIVTQLWNLRIYAGLPERMAKLEARQEMMDREASLLKESVLFRLAKIEQMLTDRLPPPK